MSLVRNEVFQVARRILQENDHRDLDWLINDDLQAYTVRPPDPPAANGLIGGTNILIFLYYFVELTANFDMGLVDARIVSRTFSSQYELWRPLIAEIVDYYQSKTGDREEIVTPPWVSMLPKLDRIMGREEEEKDRSI